MAANAVSNAAVIAGRSHTSTRPASRCPPTTQHASHRGPLRTPPPWVTVRNVSPTGEMNAADVVTHGSE